MARAAIEVAARQLASWRADGTLQRDGTDALYVYEEAAEGHVQRGLVGAVALARADARIVLPHEDTMAGPVSDRLALTAATEANLEPIFLVYEGGGAASALVASADQRVPIIDTTTPDGVRHRIWAINDPTELDAIAADLIRRRATIADGHHRYANYLQYQETRRAEGSGDGPWDFGLTLLVDTSVFGPQVHPIHRVVPGLAAADAAAKAAAAFRVTPTSDSRRRAAGNPREGRHPGSGICPGRRRTTRGSSLTRTRKPPQPRFQPTALRPGEHWTSLSPTIC